ncbi:MAG: hypothetical protein U0271_06250 [Polyangiaceae bacterium]
MMRAARLALFAGGVAGSFFANGARADEAAAAAPPPAEAPAARGGPAPPARDGELAPRDDLQPGKKRKPQDYTGRRPESSADAALWVPRVLFFPLYVVAEYFLRIPLGELTVAVEENDVINAIQNFFVFGPNKNIGLVPTAFVDFGLRPSIGLYFFYDDFIVPKNDLRASFGFGGIRFWRASVADRIPLSTTVGTERERSYLQIEADFLDRADLRYWGMGPHTSERDIAGFSVLTAGGGLRAHIEPWRATFLEAWVTGRYTTTGPGECADSLVTVTETEIARRCDPPTVRRRMLDGAAPPAHYGRPYATLKTGVRAAYDSRDPRPAPGTGLAFEASVEQVADVDAPHIGNWLNYGAWVGGFIDITGTQRVLSLEITAAFQDILTPDTTIPFTEVVGAKHIEDVPDLDMMRGFLPGRLLGSSAVAATIQYRWPIWAFLDGTIQAAVGNSFNGSHLEDFSPEKLRFSFVAGFRSPNHRDHSFNFLAGFGTDPFDQGGAVSSVRLLVGGTTGF